LCTARPAGLGTCSIFFCHSSNLWDAAQLTATACCCCSGSIQSRHRTAAAAAAGCKLWDPMTGSCLGSIDTGYALCCVYAPGNRHALVGTKVWHMHLSGIAALCVFCTCSCGFCWLRVSAPGNMQAMIGRCCLHHYCCSGWAQHS
jgi:hypothetical protein